MTAPAHAQALYRRWRPQTFTDVIGQPHITRTLTNAVAGERLAHAYLFTGPRGTGKTSVARILAKAANCTGEGDKPCNSCSICVSMTEGRSLDLIEIDAASNTGVDDVRDLRDKIAFAPNEATYKVYIVDEVHMLSTAAFNALLKTLEEPPPHALFVLATTEPHKIPDTIASRCQRHDFRRVTTGDLVTKLRRICEAEGVEASDDALEIVARSATGSIRDGESLLDQLMSLGEPITTELVRDVMGTPSDEAVVRIAGAIADQDAAAGVSAIHAAIDRGADVRQLRGQLLGHLRGLMLIQTGIDHQLLHASQEVVEAMQGQASRISPPSLLEIVRLFNDAALSADMAHPSLPLELAVVESVLLLDSGSSQTAGSGPTAQATPESPTARPQSAKRRLAEPQSTEPPTTESESTTPQSRKSPSRRPQPEAAPSAKPDSTAGGAETQPEAAPTKAETAATPSAPATPSSRRRDDGNTMARAVTSWDAIVAAVAGHDKNTAALLKDCRVTGADGDSVTLGFFYEFHCQRVSEPKRNAIVTEAASRVLGKTLRIVCTVAPETQDDKKRRPRSLAEQAKDDPVVRHAVDELGGRVAGVKKDDDPKQED